MQLSGRDYGERGQERLWRTPGDLSGAGNQVLGLTSDAVGRSMIVGGEQEGAVLMYRW